MGLADLLSVNRDGVTGLCMDYNHYAHWYARAGSINGLLGDSVSIGCGLLRRSKTRKATVTQANILDPAIKNAASDNDQSLGKDSGRYRLRENYRKISRQKPPRTSRNFPSDGEIYS